MDRGVYTATGLLWSCRTFCNRIEHLVHDSRHLKSIRGCRKPDATVTCADSGPQVRFPLDDYSGRHVELLSVHQRRLQLQRHQLARREQFEYH